MSSCIESFPQFDWDNKRNTYSSIIAGVLFFSAWWLMIDTAVSSGGDAKWTNFYFLLTAASTISMFMVNSVSNSAVTGSAMDEGVLGVKGARLWLMVGFVGSFACIVAGIWIMFGNYVVGEPDRTWPGIALFIHSFLIFISSLVYKFGRTEELWE